MARYTGPRGRRARRLFVGLSQLTEKPADKDPAVRRPYPPGQHGPTGRTRVTDYGVRLREKQKLKLLYELLEGQLVRYVDRARSAQGNPAAALPTLLESRLDAMVWRAGLATSMRQARQFVRHGYFLVDGKKVNFPRTELRPGTEVRFVERMARHAMVREAIERSSHRQVPPHLEVANGGSGFAVRMTPSGEQLPLEIDFARIIELYS